MKKIWIVFTIVCAGFQVAPAQGVLTLDECRKMALEHNKEIFAAAFQSQSAEFVWRSMRANYLPDFSLSGTGGYSTSNGNFTIPGGPLPVFVMGAQGGLKPGGFAYFPGVSLAFDTKWMYRGGVQVKQPLYYGGKIRAAQRLARIGLDIARLNEKKTSAEIVYETSEAYIQLVKAQELQKVAEKYQEVLAELMRNVESAYRNGLKPQNDVMKVKVRYNDSRLMWKKAENGTRLAAMNLCHYLGKPLTERIAVVPDFPEVEQVAADSVTICGRPEYVMVDKQVEALRQQVKLERSGMLPQVGVMADYSYTHGLPVNGQPLFDGGAFTALLNISVPVFHFGERRNKVRAVKAQLQKTILERENLNEKMWLELTRAVQNLTESGLECELADESLSQAEENRYVSGRQYEAGLEPLSDFLEAQLLWQQAYEKSVEAKALRFLHWIGYQKAAGLLGD